MTKDEGRMTKDDSTIVYRPSSKLEEIYADLN
jgi:hypothetical protein